MREIKTFVFIIFFLCMVRCSFESKYGKEQRLHVEKLNFIMACEKDNGVYFEYDGQIKCLIPPKERKKLLAE